jgi:hypothetical protein
MLETIVELWNTIKYSIIPDDMDDVAEKIVNTLIENDYDADDIREAFDGDKSIMSAVKAVTDIDAEDWDEIEEEDFDDDDYNEDYE